MLSMYNKENTKTLTIIKSLLQRLHEENVLYCHWKSNEHLAASMRGETDLDLLFEDSRRADVERILVNSGFKYFPAVRHARYPGVVDYIGMDPDTTRIVHVHAHFRLTAGEKYLKGYHLPWERLLLTTRIFDTEHEIYTAEPNIEAILLLTREALKHRTRDSLQMLLGRPWLGDDSRRELRWLSKRVEREEIDKILPKLGANEQLARLYRMLLDSEGRLLSVLKFVRAIKNFCRPHRHYHPLAAGFICLFREARSRGLQRVKRVSRNLPPAIPIRRVRPERGLLIAFIGSDGSGKSTACASTSKWLGKKLDVVSLYLGSGQGPSSLARRALTWLRGFRKRAPKLKVGVSPSMVGPGSVDNNSRFSPTVYRVIWALLLACERRRKLRRAWTARSRGIVVVTDRFPQAQVFGFNDGPLLVQFRNHKSRILRWAATWEWRTYDEISALYRPDLVFRLHVSPVVASGRRPEMTIEETRRKQDALFSVSWSGTSVVTINADQDLEAVTREIRTMVWSIL